MHKQDFSLRRKLLLHVSLLSCLNGFWLSAVVCLLHAGLAVTNWNVMFGLLIPLCPLHQSVEKKAWYGCELVNCHVLLTHILELNECETRSFCKCIEVSMSSSMSALLIFVCILIWKRWSVLKWSLQFPVHPLIYLSMKEVPQFSHGDESFIWNNSGPFFLWGTILDLLMTVIYIDHCRECSFDLVY